MVMAVVAVSVFGWNWERSEQRAFAALNLEPPRPLVAAGAHRLHVVADGAGSPGILFISGLGDDWRTWDRVAERLAGSTRVVRYDRPGLGWSPRSDDALTVDAAVADIKALLADTALFAGPPILVGHSLGGPLARQFARQYPSLVAGMVLLDPTPVHAMPTMMNVMGSWFYRLMAWSGAVGLKRWRHYRARPQLTREQQLRSAFLNASGATSRESLREFRGVVGSPVLEPSRGVLATMPLTVLAAPMVAPPGFAGAVARADAAKRLLVEESERGRLVEVATGHYIHWEDPDTVVAEVLRMLDLIRSDSGTRVGNLLDPSGATP